MISDGVQLSKEQMDIALKSKNKKSLSAGSTGDVEVSLSEIDSFGDNESLLRMARSIDSYNKMLNQSITLVNDSLTATIPFTRENLYLFCAFTGSGKSTVAANISYPLWKQGKKTLVISNEESEQDVIFRIGCLELGYNFNDYKKGKMPTDKQHELMELFKEITKYVKVIDVNAKEGITRKVEGIKAYLNAVKTADYCCVMIDYYQLIQSSLKDPSKTTYEVLNDLRVWLGQYIKSSNVPVVLFVQLYSIGKKGGVKDIDARIKECSAIVEPATVIIEVVPDFETKTSSFIIHKDRFGEAGKRIVCPFDKGRFQEALSADELSQREAQAKRNKASAALDAMIAGHNVAE